MVGLSGIIARAFRFLVQKEATESSSTEVGCRQGHVVTGALEGFVVACGHPHGRGNSQQPCYVLRSVRVSFRTCENCKKSNYKRSVLLI